VWHAQEPTKASFIAPLFVGLGCATLIIVSAVMYATYAYGLASIHGPLLAALLAGFGLLILLVLITVALWDSHRLLALGGGTVVLVVAAGVAVSKVKALIDQPATLFQASIGELRADADALRRAPGP